MIESADRYRVLVEQSPDGIAIYDQQGWILEANDRALEMLGYTHDEMMGLNVGQVVAPEDLARQPLRFEALRTGMPLIDERLLVRKDSSRMPVEISARMLNDGMIQVILRDITERKRIEGEIRTLNTQLEERIRKRTEELEKKNRKLRAEITKRKQVEESLRISQSRLQRLVDSNIIGVHIADFEGKIVDSNDAFLDMMGYTREELEKGRMNWKKLTPAEYLARDEEALRQLEERGACDMYEKIYRRKDGTLVPVLIGRARLEGPTKLAIAYILNISERKQAEQEREQLLEKEREARRDAEEAVHTRDELLAIVSHDLKNPLTAIKGYSQLLRRRLAIIEPEIAPRLEQVIERIDESSNKMNQMLNDLLDFGRLQAGQALSLQLRPVNLVEVARYAARDFGRSSPLHRIVIESKEEAIVGRWDATRLEQVLANLLSNAVKYSPNGGTITLKLWCEPRSRSGEGEQRGWAVLAAQDQGMGIAESELAHIFEWYRRAKNVAGRISGAGIGLASVKYIVTQHGGEITVASERGRGSTFTVRLPL